MRFIISIFLFLIIISFCFYWFNDSNPNRNDFSQVPYVGNALRVVSKEYNEIRFYLDSGQGNVWDYVKNLPEVKKIIDRLLEIYNSNQSFYPL